MATAKNISVLFTDIVGSTELSMTMSVEENDHLIRTHFALLRQCVARNGGTEVKSLGDGIMAVFPTASGALSCAVAMQQAVDRDNRTERRSVGLRVGLSAGEATLDRGDYYGDPVIEASRLCARAEGGQILLADLVRATAGRRAPYQFTSLGELELKGLRDPVPTLALGWEPVLDDGTAARVPRPSRARRRLWSRPPPWGQRPRGRDGPAQCAGAASGGRRRASGDPRRRRGRGG